MRTTSKFLALALAAALQPAAAGTVSVNFEDVTSNVLASNYSAPGVTFSGDAWAVRSRLGACGSSGLIFSRDGSCGALFLAASGSSVGTPTSDGKSFVIDVAEGFVDAFSFLYGLRSGSNVTITVFDQLGGQGNELLRKVGLTGTQCENSSRQFCDPQWYAYTSSKFNGVAHSVVVSGIDQRLMLDNLTFTTASNTGTLPEPTSAALALGALGALGWCRRRTAR